MYKKGHLGSAYLTYAVLAFAFLSHNLFFLFLVGYGSFTSLFMLPDIDNTDFVKKYIPIKHRGFTHTVWFALIIGCGFAVCGYFVATFFPSISLPIVVIEQPSPALYTVSFFLIGFLTVIGHLLGDIITPWGLTPFTPISKKKYRIELLVFPVPAKSSLGNLLLFWIGFLIFTVSTIAGLYYSGIHTDLIRLVTQLTSL